MHLATQRTTTGKKHRGVPTDKVTEIHLDLAIRSLRNPLCGGREGSGMFENVLEGLARPQSG